VTSPGVAARVVHAEIDRLDRRVSVDWSRNRITSGAIAFTSGDSKTRGRGNGNSCEANSLEMLSRERRFEAGREDKFRYFHFPREEIAPVNPVLIEY
jgi:hypothetical protein